MVGPDRLPVVTHAHFIGFQGQCIVQVLAVIADGSTQISIPLLYRRIFTYWMFKIITAMFIAIVLSWMIAFTFATSFQYSPIDTSWTQPLGEATPGKCLDIYTFYLATALTDLLTDVMVLALPVPAVMRSHMPLGRRISVAIVFLLGSIVLVFGALRIQNFFYIGRETKKSADLSYPFPQTHYWTLAETSVGIICACLPTIVPAFNPNIEGSFTHSLSSIPLLRRSFGTKSQVDGSQENTSEQKRSKSSELTSSQSETVPVVYAGPPTQALWTAGSLPLGRRAEMSEVEARGIVVKQDVYVSKI